MTFFYSDACGNKGGPYFPPKLDILLAWSQLFRSKDTFGNYLNHVRTACILVKQPIEACESLPSASVNPPIVIDYGSGVLESWLKEG